MSAPKDTRAAGLLAAARFARKLAERKAGARDRARADMRPLVAECRQSDVETCAEIARECEAQARAARRKA